MTIKILNLVTGQMSYLTLNRCNYSTSEIMAEVRRIVSFYRGIKTDLGTRKYVTTIDKFNS